MVTWRKPRWPFRESPIWRCQVFQLFQVVKGILDQVSPWKRHEDPSPTFRTSQGNQHSLVHPEGMPLSCQISKNKNAKSLGEACVPFRLLCCHLDEVGWRWNLGKIEKNKRQGKENYVSEENRIPSSTMITGLQLKSFVLIAEATPQTAPEWAPNWAHPSKGHKANQPTVSQIKLEPEHCSDKKISCQHGQMYKDWKQMIKYMIKYINMMKFPSIPAP